MIIVLPKRSGSLSDVARYTIKLRAFCIHYSREDEIFCILALILCLTHTVSDLKYSGAP